MQFPINIGLRRSRILDALLLIAALLAGGISLSFQCSMSAHACLFAAILVSATLAWKSLKPSIKILRLERNGDISIARVDDGDFVRAIPMPGATLHPWLSVIRLNIEDSRSCTLIAAPDNLTGTDFRRLRMFMRWQANFSGLGDDA